MARAQTCKRREVLKYKNERTYEHKIVFNSMERMAFWLATKEEAAAMGTKYFLGWNEAGPLNKAADGEYICCWLARVTVVWFSVYMWV